MSYQFDKATFYNKVREAYGPLNAKQVEGFSYILDQATRRALRWDNLSYALATAWLETGYTMQPVKEAFWVKNAEAYRKKHFRYWPYYGRGYIQLTWLDNYKRATAHFRDVLGIKVDFVANPDLVMIPEYAAIIMFVGMEQGWFTGKRFDTYLDGIDESDVEDREEFRKARRIINGTDRDDDIAEFAITFEHALRSAGYGPAPVADPVPARPGGPLRGTRPEVVIWDDADDPVGPAPPPVNITGWTKLADLIGKVLKAVIEAGKRSSRNAKR